jgi:ABC-type Fe3+-hydroxamate transport system substrate-binding protein
VTRSTRYDDLGHPMRFERPPTRVVSLVPSLSEALAESVPERLVAVTDWCTHTAGLDLPRVRGTKNPDRQAITALKPDLVIANQEENRQLDVQRLRDAGVPVWVTVIESLDDALHSMRRLFTDVLATGEPEWLRQATEQWSRPAPRPELRVIVPVWRDPWMVVGARTFTGDILARLGLVNVFGDADGRYPHADLADLRKAGADLILLPDEPYVFTPDDGPEAFPHTRTVLLPGRQLTWYGPSLATARTTLLDQIR